MLESNIYLEVSSRTVKTLENLSELDMSNKEANNYSFIHTLQFEMQLPNGWKYTLFGEIHWIIQKS